jgi:hypothetical protein
MYSHIVMIVQLLPHISIRPFIRPSIYPSTIHPSIQPTNPSMHPCIYPPIHNTGAFTTWEYALLFTRSWRSLDENDPKKDICSHRVKNMVKILGQLERQHQVSQEYETKRTSERLSSLPPRKSGAQVFTVTVSNALITFIMQDRDESANII